MFSLSCNWFQSFAFHSHKKPNRQTNKQIFHHFVCIPVTEKRRRWEERTKLLSFQGKHRATLTLGPAPACQVYQENSFFFNLDDKCLLVNYYTKCKQTLETNLKYTKYSKTISKIITLQYVLVSINKHSLTKLENILWAGGMVLNEKEANLSSMYFRKVITDYFSKYEHIM